MKKFRLDEIDISNFYKIITAAIERAAIRCAVLVSDSDTSAKYTFNLQAEIVDVAATNVKPRLNFQDVSIK